MQSVQTISLPAVSRLAIARVRSAVFGAPTVVVLLLAIVSASEPSMSASASATGPTAVPLAARSLVSSTLGRDQASYRIQRSAGDLVGKNSAHGLSIRFGVRGIEVRAGEDTFAMRLRSVPAVEPTAHGNRVAYRRGSLTEWYANGPFGLEQGFTVKSRPADARGAPLTLALSLSGNLRPTLDRGGDALTFAGSSLRYTGLSAFDRGGKELPARLELRPRTLLIRVDDRDAHYPLTIDPFLQLAKLTASDGATRDFLGYSVSISGDTVVAGSQSADVSGNADQGAVYVFVKPAGGWTSAAQTAKLNASDGAAFDHLGQSVAIAEDTIVAGAPAANVSGRGRPGAAYVFVKPAGGWANATQTAKLTASDGAVSDQLGSSVAISGSTIVAGTYSADVSGHGDQGAVYVFVKPAGGWANVEQTAKLTVSNGAAQDYLGRSVAIEDDAIVAGAPGVGVYDLGAAYVFAEPAGGWASGTQTAKLTAYEPIGYGGSAHRFGESVAIAGDTIVVGDPGIGTGCQGCGQGAQGTVYVFVTPGRAWNNKTQTAKLTASNAANYDHLGTSVGIAGDTIVAGADPDAAHDYVYVFVKPAGGWASGTETERVANSDGAATQAVAIAGDTIVGGARYAPVSGHSWQGAAYVSSSSIATITLTKQLVPASSPGRFDLKVGGTVVRASAGNGTSGSIKLPSGTYRVSESGAAGTSLDDYATSIACTVNGNPGPAASGTTHLDVTAAKDDVVKCTLTNRRKAQVTLVKHLVPASDPGRFDLKLTSSNGVRVVRTNAGDGDSGSIKVAPGPWTVVESAVSGTNLSNYTSSIACTRNGNPGPSGNGPSLQLTLSPADVLVCTLTNQRK